MLRVLFYRCCLFILLKTTLVISLNAVFDLPAKLSYNRQHSVIVTTFHEMKSERLTVAVNVRYENQSLPWTPIRIESSIAGSSLVNTRRLFLMVNSTPERLTLDRNNDVMFYVIVEVSVTSSNGDSWVQQKQIPVVKLKGHILIQTDRRVYKPGDPVFVRFIPVDELMKPLEQPMDMSIMAPNPKLGGSPLVSWTKKKSATNQVLVRSFVLPETPPIGQWVATAKFYRNDVMNDQFTSVFYVEDVTLPTFDLTVQPIRESFIVSNDQVLWFEIEAKFIYGEFIDGSASIRVGLLNELWRNNPLFITHVMSNQVVQRGKMRFPVHVANVTNGYNISALMESSTRLFVEVFVTENGGVHTRSIRNTDVIFTSAPLVISIDEMAAYFKPELLYTVQVDVTFTNATAARNVPVAITVTGNRASGGIERIFSDVISTSNEGRIIRKITAPSNINYMKVSVRGIHNYNGRSYPTEIARRIYPQTSPHRQYMQIISPQREYTVGMMSDLQLHFTSSSQAKTVVYTVSSIRGYSREGMVEASPGASRVSISLRVVSEMSPISHVTAYYVTNTAEGLPFIVADSTSIAVEDTCLGRELSLTLPGTGTPYPGDMFALDVRGEPESYIGLTGVDTAIGVMEEDFAPDDSTNSASVSRKSLSNILRSSAPGCKKLTTPFTESAFATTGRVLLSSVSHNIVAASSVRCYGSRSSRRNKRSVTMLWMRDSSLLRSANDYLGNYYECCAVGASNVSAVVTYDEDTCLKRAETVSINEECRNRFLECCLDAERKTMYPNQKTRKVGTRQSSYVTVTHTGMPFFTGASVMERAVQLTRNNFAWTWFNADFNLGTTGHKLMNNESNPKLPHLPDSITSWTIRGFSLSQERGLCAMEPVTFSVEHSLFIEVELPPSEVVRGNLFPVEVTVYNYLPHQIWANISLDSKDDNLCTSTDTVVRNRLIRASQGGAYTDVVRFNVIPLEAGSYKIKVRMAAFYDNILQPHIDTVIKTLEVIPEGIRKQHVEWILVDSRHSDRRRSPLLTPMIHLPFPNNSIPGSEEALIKVHSLATAFLQPPKFSPDECSTISQYLYQLQFIISKLEISRSQLTAMEVEGLTKEANTAYTGVLRYLHDVTDSDGVDPLYGFSYSPAATSKPDLWLTCATLRTIFLVSELVNIDPDEKILTGSLRWIMRHQNRGRKAFFAKNPVKNSKPSRNVKSPPTIKSKASSTLPSNQQRRNTEVTRIDFESKLDKKLYRTSVISFFLYSILKSTNERTKPNTRRHPESFNSINSYDLRDSLRRSLLYIKVNIMKTHRKSASPLVIAASARAICKLTGNVDPRLEETLDNLKQENSDGDLWWIEDTNENGREPSRMRRMKTKSSSIETTAYALQLITLRGQQGSNYANWLLKQRKRNNRWVSLVSTLAAAEALQSFVSEETSSVENNLRVNIGSAEMSVPSSISPRSTMGNEMKVSTASNVVNMSMSGVGKAWVELDVAYNIPQAESTGEDSQTSDPQLCPFEVTVSVYPVPVSETFFSLRSLTSSILLQVDLVIRFKSWYDPFESGDLSFVVDFGLHSNYKPVLKDLEMLSNPIERTIDHYRVTKRGLLLYFSDERKISFKLTEKRTNENIIPLPYSVYPAAYPERRCRSFYSPPGVRPQVSTLCSNSEERRRTGKSMCLCVTSGSCPKVVSRSKSVKATTQSRIKLTCKAATKFAYRVRFENTENVGRDWMVYSGQIRHVYKSSAELRGSEHNSTFWVRKTCDVQRISLNKDYLLTGRSIVQGDNGVYKHLLDSFARFEQWPGRHSNCDRFTGQTLTLCRKLNDYGYNMRINGCPN